MKIRLGIAALLAGVATLAIVALLADVATSARIPVAPPNVLRWKYVNGRSFQVPRTIP